MKVVAVDLETRSESRPWKTKATQGLEIRVAYSIETLVDTSNR